MHVRQTVGQAWKRTARSMSACRTDVKRSALPVAARSGFDDGPDLLVGPLRSLFEPANLLGEKLMQGLNRCGTFAYCRRHALNRSAAYIADGKHAGMTGFQIMRRAFERPVF